MPPRSESTPPLSSLGFKPPKTRGSGGSLFTDLWLDERRENDGAEGLWRIHDSLYDLTQFVDKHPGGSEWITMTRGTDITEAFEIHHWSQRPGEILKNYFVKNASSKRNSPFTFHEDGFYKTLKRELEPVLKNIPEQSRNNTNFLCDAMLFFMFVFSLLAVHYQNYWLGSFAGIVLGMLTIASHNYFHMKDNLRMYYFQFSMMQVRDWRISHVLSHHIYTNTVMDLEISMFEPIFQYLPVKKTHFQRIRSFLLAPVTYFFFFHVSLIRRLLVAPKCNYKNLKVTDWTGLSLPLLMYVFGGTSLLDVLLMWNWIMAIGGTYFIFIGLTGSHHHPDIFHDGDTPRAKDNYDWGLSQLDSVMDHKEITGSHFLVLVNFGDHALHHLFPTLDHGALEHCYPVFEKVLQRFDENARFVTKWETLRGSYQQLIREKPNPNPPELKKYGGRV